MGHFVLIPGAGGMSYIWHRVVDELASSGHDATAVDLPGDDPSAGLPEYTDLVVAAIGDDTEAVVVAQSLGGFTAPLVAARVPVRRVVLVNAMIPQPGETAGAWWGTTGAVEARTAAAVADGTYPQEFDDRHYFLHDVPAAEVAQLGARLRPEADVVFGQPCAFVSWPDVPIRVVAGREDRFFPLGFQRRTARERLGVEPEVVPGGHLAALSSPGPLVERILDVSSPSARRST
jgi:pimeloyl-ACP methyl ester carboxylesterase